MPTHVSWYFLLLLSRCASSPRSSARNPVLATSPRYHRFSSVFRVSAPPFYPETSSAPFFFVAFPLLSQPIFFRYPLAARRGLLDIQIPEFTGSLVRSAKRGCWNGGQWSLLRAAPPTTYNKLLFQRPGGFRAQKLLLCRVQLKGARSHLRSRAASSFCFREFCQSAAGYLYHSPS